LPTEVTAYMDIMFDLNAVPEDGSGLTWHIVYLHMRYAMARILLSRHFWMMGSLGGPMSAGMEKCLEAACDCSLVVEKFVSTGKSWLLLCPAAAACMFHAGWVHVAVLLWRPAAQPPIAARSMRYLALLMRELLLLGDSMPHVQQLHFILKRLAESGDPMLLRMPLMSVE
jgi:hypothetical protein